MTGEHDQSSSELSEELLGKLGSLPIADGLSLLEERNADALAVATSLADAALAQAENVPANASHWLELATALNKSPDLSIFTTGSTETTSSSAQDPKIQARIIYAQARLHVVRGNLQLAEDALIQARSIWSEEGDQASINRSALGLTQILATLGRHAEAESVIQEAIASLSSTPPSPHTLMLLGDAQHNLATLLLYQERNREALAHYESAEQTLGRVRLLIQADPNEEDAEWDEAIDLELAHANLNRASALMALDLIQEAEELLTAARTQFEQSSDLLNRGRASTNLGTLLLRTGRYATALMHFEDAAADLLAEDTLMLAQATDPLLDEPLLDEAALEQLRQADTLLLEQAMAYVALNLRREATNSLMLCQALFRRAQMPYELAQTLWTSGRLYLGDGDFEKAEAALSEAESLFRELQNLYWQNRTRLALAMLAYRRGAYTEAQTLTESIPTKILTAPEDATTAGEIRAGEIRAESTISDVGMVAEALLLRTYLALARGKTASASALSDAVLEVLHRYAGEVDVAELVPHLWLRIMHVRGKIARERGQWHDAQRYFYSAIDLLEKQRTTLSLEEIRTAYLDDKMGIYRDLVLALIDASSPEKGAQDTELIRRAFDAVERARSRALLERLIALANESGQVDAKDGPQDETRTIERLAELRQELHWLYNRLLGDDGSRNLSPDLSQKIRRQEEQIERLDVHKSLLHQQAQPEGLAELQASLAADEQALVFYIADVDSTSPLRVRHRHVGREEATTVGEVMVFLVDREKIQLFRHLCSESLLVQMQDDLRFQMGRAELGEAYLARHCARIERALRSVLQQLYDVLIRPLAGELQGNRLLIVPHGSLHLLPFHLLWNGDCYMVERYELSYVPSASIAVHCSKRQARHRCDEADSKAHSWAGVAVTDAAIPQAPAEVMAAAQAFASAQLFLAQDASRKGLRRAAQSADLLHIATHGLFRADNPFFSALKLDDGWIDVREIYQLPLTARLVVLSACDSGLSRVRGGDELIGLVRGFLGAGAQGLIASLWTVNDASAARLMQDFYRELTTDQRGDWSPARALRSAQLQALARGEHPYFWASFYMIGR